MLASDVPSEIWGLVFTFFDQEAAQLLWDDHVPLHKETLSDLLYISLVCRQWSHISQSHRHRSISLNDFDSALLLVDKLNSKQDVAVDSVQSTTLLHFADTIDPWTDFTNTSDDHEKGGPNNIRILKELFKHMPTLHTLVVMPGQFLLLSAEPSIYQHLRHLTLTNSNDHICYDYFEDVDTYLDHHTLCPYIPSQLITLSVRDCPQILGCSISKASKIPILELQHLEINEWFQDQSDDAFEVAKYVLLPMPKLKTANIRMQLKHESIGYPTDYVYAATPIMKLFENSMPRTLRSLTLNINAPISEVECLFLCMGKVFNNLENLDYTGPVDIIPDSLSDSLEQLLSLRTLTLTATIDYRDGHNGIIQSVEGLVPTIRSFMDQSYLPNLIKCPSVAFTTVVPYVPSFEEHRTLETLIRAARTSALALRLYRGFDSQRNVVSSSDMGTGILRLLPSCS